MGCVRRASDAYQNTMGGTSAGTVMASSVPAWFDVSSVNTATSAAFTACAIASSAAAVSASRRRYVRANTRSRS